VTIGSDFVRRVEIYSTIKLGVPEIYSIIIDE
jgi:hypothetical protein